MPQFFEKKLKEQYGADSPIPYKIMNAQGLMQGSKETKKGAALQAKHERHSGGSIGALRRKTGG